MRQPLGRSTGVARWSFWTLPTRLKVPIVLVDVLVFLSFVAGTACWIMRGIPLHASWPWLAAALVLAGVLGTEASLGVERMRRQTDANPHLDLSSVWIFAGAVLLPVPLAATVATVIYAHIYLRVGHPSGLPLHRAMFSTATILLAVQLAALVTTRLGGDALFRSLNGMLAVVAGMIAYTAVNLALVVLVIVVSGQERGATVRQVLGPVDDVALEFATLSMGALVAAAASTFGPAYVLLGLPPVIVLHRTVLVRQLEEDASTDSKTGLLNAAAWRERAARALLSADRVDRPPRYWCSTSITSSSSTTASGTSSATRCSQPSPRPCRTRCAMRTSSAGSAARSSWCCCAASTATTPGPARRRRPSGSESGSRACASPCPARRVR